METRERERPEEPELELRTYGIMPETVRSVVNCSVLKSLILCFAALSRGPKTEVLG